MSHMVEIDIDFDYCGEVEMILAHDECGEHEDVEFYRNDLLASENAKLRNLVEALLQCAGETKRDKGCDACPMWTEIYEDDYLRYSSCMLRPTLKEIGIEWK